MSESRDKIIKLMQDDNSETCGIDADKFYCTKQESCEACAADHEGGEMIPNNKITFTILPNKKTKKKKYCCWKHEENGEYFSTKCGEAQCFSADGIKENKYVYCPYCGKKIQESK
jgi:DNA-directed RNA polymerase subunit RPC12/RpoP